MKCTIRLRYYIHFYILYSCRYEHLTLLQPLGNNLDIGQSRKEHWQTQRRYQHIYTGKLYLLPAAGKRMICERILILDGLEHQDSLQGLNTDRPNFLENGFRFRRRHHANGSIYVHYGEPIYSAPHMAFSDNRNALLWLQKCFS
jgi:hypothetical protein